jgi:hypothetical protein
MMQVILASLVLMLNAPLANGGSVEQKISFHFESPASSIPEFTLDVAENGTAKYWEGQYPTDQAEQKRVSVLTISAPTLAKIFAAKPQIVAGECETHLKNIANTGKKKLIYAGGGEGAECIFNYSDDEKVNTAAAAFQGIAFTLQEGVKLKHDHRFDHLGLDAHLDSLTASVKQGWAIELQNIAPILQSIVDDDEMMSPARRKAKNLLDMASVQAAASAR